MKILFVSWDGPQVTYLEGLFLPIFVALRGYGIRVHVLQFTWADATSVGQTRRVYQAAGIGYQSVRVLRVPKALGAVLTTLWGGWVIRRAVRRHGIDVVMPRSVLPGLATLLSPGLAVPIVFDADGLPIDERVEFLGESPTLLRQRVMRSVEVQLVRKAQLVLARTRAATVVLRARAGAGTVGAKFRVVGNGRDARRFHPFETASRARIRDRLGIEYNAPLVVYAGSIGAQYCPAGMLRLFARVLARRPDAKLLVLTRGAGSFLEQARQMAIPDDALVLRSARAEDVPEYLACADLGLALRSSTFSMRAVAPIKLGEYLLCGVPVVASSVIGKSCVIDDTTGFRVRSTDDELMDKAADWLIDTVLPDREGFRVRCNELGQSSFSLDDSVRGYLDALCSLSTAQATTPGVPHRLESDPCAD